MDSTLIIIGAVALAIFIIYWIFVITFRLIMIFKYNILFVIAIITLAITMPWLLAIIYLLFFHRYKTPQKSKRDKDDENIIDAEIVDS